MGDVRASAFGEGHEGADESFGDVAEGERTRRDVRDDFLRVFRREGDEGGY